MENRLNKIWIYGDSFSDPNYQNEYLETVDLNSWPNRLAQRYDVRNRSIEGSGPDYALKRLLDDIDVTPVEDLKNITMIFLQSDVHRFNLHGIYKDNDPKQQVYAKHIASGEHKHPSKMFMKSLFQHLAVQGWHGREQLKFYSTINSIAHNFDRVAYITVGGFHPVYSPIIKPVDNLNFVPSNFMASSLKEPEATMALPDPRPNHFSPRCHDYILEHITQWLSVAGSLNFEDLDRVAANA